MAFLNIKLLNCSTIRDKITFFSLLYTIILSLIVLKTSIFNYNDSKLHPSTLEEAKEVGYDEKLITCNSNPLKLLPITGCISYPTEKWLWRVIVAYNSGFVFYELEKYMNPGEGRSLVVLKLQQLCLYLISFAFDLPLPMYSYHKLWDEDFIIRLTWYIHIPVTLIFGFMFVLMMSFQKHWKYFGMGAACLTVGYFFWTSANGDFGVPCLPWSLSVFCIIEYCLGGCFIWYIREYMLVVTSEARKLEEPEEVEASPLKPDKI